MTKDALLQLCKKHDVRPLTQGLYISSDPNDQTQISLETRHGTIEVRKGNKVLVFIEGTGGLVVGELAARVEKLQALCRMALDLQTEVSK